MRPLVWSRTWCAVDRVAPYADARLMVQIVRKGGGYESRTESDNDSERGRARR